MPKKKSSKEIIKKKRTVKKTEYISTNRDQYTVVLESIKSENRAVTELVMHLHDKFDTYLADFEHLKASVELLRASVELLKASVELLKADVECLRADVENLKADVELIKGEVALIRHNQITRDEFKLLETRVMRLEQLQKSR